MRNIRCLKQVKNLLEYNTEISLNDYQIKGDCDLYHL